jgi:hypothetical protein
MKVINKITGKVSPATYCQNRLGNMRYWVDGKFFSDKKFDKTFVQIDITEHYIKIKGKWVAINQTH